MQLDCIYSENRTKEMSSLKEWFLSNDRVKNEELELEIFYSNEYNFETDSISCACYVWLFAVYASKLSHKMVTKKMNGKVCWFAWSWSWYNRV